MSRVTVVPALLLLVLAACLDTTAPEDSTLRVPLLLAPVAATPPLRQNDPTTGCTFSNVGGYGFQVAFKWGPVDGATKYRLLLQRTGAELPVLNVVLGQRSYDFVSCNAYVIDANLTDWVWSVAAIASDGTQGAWAEQGTFRFEPAIRPFQR